jgi:hypothetical protein
MFLTRKTFPHGRTAARPWAAPTTRRYALEPPVLGFERPPVPDRMIASEARHRALRRDLLLDDVRDLPDAAYRGLLDYEREAAELGYPELL